MNFILLLVLTQVIKVIKCSVYSATMPALLREAPQMQNL